MSFRTHNQTGKRIAFRVDSNSIISSGHVMRCLSLADAFSAEGYNCVFILSTSDMSVEIEQRDHSAVILDSDWENPTSDFPKLGELLEVYKPEVLIIDSYSISSDYVTSISEYCRVGYLGCKHIAARDLSLLINYEFDIDTEFYDAEYYGSNTLLLLGPKFAPLRQQFSAVKPRQTQRIDSVLITTGNSVNHDFLFALLGKLANTEELNTVEFHLVVGKYFKCEEELNKLLCCFPNLSVYYSVNNMAQLMASVDAAISACGTTIYELGACSIPTIGFSLVEEQLRVASSLKNTDAILYAGEAYSNPLLAASNAVSLLCDLCNNPCLKKLLGSELHSLSDGCGADRIVSEVLAAFSE